MNNYIQDGKSISYKNQSGSKINGGDLVVMGKICGVAVADIENGEIGGVVLEGVFELPKKTKSDVVALGDQLVYDSGIKVITAASTLPIVSVGHAVEPSAATDETVIVKLG